MASHTGHTGALTWTKLTKGYFNAMVFCASLCFPLADPTNSFSFATPRLPCKTPRLIFGILLGWLCECQSSEQFLWNSSTQTDKCLVTKSSSMKNNESTPNLYCRNSCSLLEFNERNPSWLTLMQVLQVYKFVSKCKCSELQPHHTLDTARLLPYSSVQGDLVQRQGWYGRVSSASELLLLSKHLLSLLWIIWLCFIRLPGCRSRSRSSVHKWGHHRTPIKSYKSKKEGRMLQSCIICPMEKTSHICAVGSPMCITMHSFPLRVLSWVPQFKESFLTIWLAPTCKRPTEHGWPTELRATCVAKLSVATWLIGPYWTMGAILHAHCRVLQIQGICSR